MTVRLSYHRAEITFGDTEFNSLDLNAAFDTVDPNCSRAHMWCHVKVDCGTRFSVFMPPSGQITENS